MKIYISDVCGKCCPENVDLGRANKEQSERVSRQVFEKLGMKQPERSKRGGKAVRTVFLVAAILSLLTVSAFAVARFALVRQESGGIAVGYWREFDQNGEILSEQQMVFPYAAMVFNFVGSGTDARQPEFRCYYLPSEPDFGYTDQEGWTKYLTDSGEGLSLPYVISCGVLDTGRSSLVLSGKPELLREERTGDWLVLEISSDYSECEGYFRYENDRANYILMFDEVRGWFVNISGTSDIETLRLIAGNMEIRESDQPRSDFGNRESIGIIEPGRG